MPHDLSRAYQYYAKKKFMYYLVGNEDWHTLELRSLNFLLNVLFHIMYFLSLEYLKMIPHISTRHAFCEFL